MKRPALYRQPSPLGDLLLAATSSGLCLVSFEQAELERLESRLGQRASFSPVTMRPFVAELEAYFRGDRRSFTLPLDLVYASEFARRVLVFLRAVPFGELITYGGLARQARTSPRAVGVAVARNPVAIVVPCHRVIGTSGSLVGYSAGLERKRWLLEFEGSLFAGDLRNTSAASLG
ncbi:MAG: methylated-DNA--[protein]-cysteine S-methyltransferase [Actinomycetota bacterium]|nr:methylated-DNA--[protein]-cysteine S-methyltransferase [Actinomycetota bacterium]